MFCQKCGTALEVNATACFSCNTRTSSAKFCQKCGETLPGDVKVCGNCNTRSSVPNAPTHWLSLCLSFVAFITFGFLGGDYYLQEINVFDYLTIPISLAALISAVVLIPNKRIILKVICIILSAFLLLGSIGWVFM